MKNRLFFWAGVGLLRVGLLALSPLALLAESYNVTYDSVSFQMKKPTAAQLAAANPELAGGGATIYGSGVPSAGLGSNGNTYIDVATGNFYKKASGSWGAAYFRSQPYAAALAQIAAVGTLSANTVSFLGAADYATMRSLLSLGNVENTALSTWAGSANITTVGTIAAGTWQGTAIANSFIASALTGKTYNGLSVTSTTGTLTLTNAKTVSFSNTLTFAGTDASTLNIGSGGTLGSNAFTSTAFVPQTTTVNGHALSGNVSVTLSDLGISAVTNDAQTKAAIVPNTVPSAGQILVGNAGGTAYVPVSMSSDATMASTGAITIAANAVTNAKSAQMAAHTWKGNSTGSTANAADNTFGTGADTALGNPVNASAGLVTAVTQTAGTTGATNSVAKGSVVYFSTFVNGTTTTLTLPSSPASGDFFDVILIGANGTATLTTSATVYRLGDNASGTVLTPNQVGGSNADHKLHFWYDGTGAKWRYTDTFSAATNLAGTGSGGVTGSLPAASVAAGALANGMTATTQAQGDRSTKVATNDFASPHINAQTGTTYTIAATDANQYLTLSNASAITLTVPLNATTAYTDGDTIAIQQKGAGLVTVHPVSGSVTINGASSDVAFLGQYQWATLVKIGTGTDTWMLAMGPRVVVASGKTVTVNNTLTLAGTDSTTITFPSTSATVARIDAANAFTGASTTTSWTNTTQVIAGASASGSSNIDLSGGSGSFTLPTGGLIAPNSSLANRFRSNSNVSAQAPSATTRTYVTGSDIGPFTATQIKVGTYIEWDLSITKTGAGTASSTFDIAFGTAGTTSDTARVSFTKPAGVGNADTCHVRIVAVVKTNSASGVVLGDFVLTDDQTGAGGFLASGKYNSVLQVQSSTFDTTTPTHVGICITTGASDAYTINYCTVKSWNL